MITRREHPIAYGYDEVHHVFRINGPVYTVPRHHEHWIVSQYGTKPPDDDEDSDSEQEDDSDSSADSSQRRDFLVTGFVSGRKELERKAVVLDIPRHAGGRVVLYSFNPLHRFLNHGDHNYVFNALLHWNDFPAPVPRDDPRLALD